jgi:transposase
MGWAARVGQGRRGRRRFDEVEQVLVVSVRPRKATKRRCGRCGKRCPGYDQGEGRRRWRTLDLGLIRAFLEADAPRVSCPEHGVIAAQVPWARHGAGHTYAFDDTAAWLVTHCSKSAVRDLLRIAWRTVGSIVTRVVADAEATTDRFANLRRIGIARQISYKRGHKYLTVVVDHDSGVLLWARGLHGAEAVLKLRALHSNGDWDEYWRYGLSQEEQRIHQSLYAADVIPQAA